MEILRSIPELAAVEGPLSLAMGVFDGVHLGHQAVIEKAIEDARARGGKAYVVTFEPHPVRVLKPEAAPRLLASLQHKALLLGRMGVDGVLAITFDRVFAGLTPGEFVGRVAEACRDLSSISIGAGWRFGAGRAGDAGLLGELGDELGFVVYALPAVSAGGSPVSSTRVRAAIEEGDLAGARGLLGRDYTVLGTVVSGQKLGRGLGFPTANLRVQSEQLPPNGVYAVRAFFGGRELHGVANLGLRPTVEAGSHHRMLEVHLFDFGEEIYGQDLEVTFVQFLRGEKKFDGLEALKGQIARDVEEARGVLEMTE